MLVFTWQGHMESWTSRPPHQSSSPMKSSSPIVHICCNLCNSWSFWDTYITAESSTCKLEAYFGLKICSCVIRLHTGYFLKINLYCEIRKYVHLFCICLNKVEQIHWNRMDWKFFFLIKIVSEVPDLWIQTSYIIRIWLCIEFQDIELLSVPIVMVVLASV
jgi:hypothetical protein